MSTKELVAASSTPMILSILSRGESYGYEILQQIKEVSCGELDWSEGMLYPLLHRLEGDGLVKSFWKTTDSGRKRKYYKLNQQGKTVLKQEKEKWEKMNSTLNKLWEELYA